MYVQTVKGKENKTKLSQIIFLIIVNHRFNYFYSAVLLCCSATASAAAKSKRLVKKKGCDFSDVYVLCQAIRIYLDKYELYDEMTAKHKLNSMILAVSHLDVN